MRTLPVFSRIALFSLVIVLALAMGAVAAQGANVAPVAVDDSLLPAQVASLVASDGEAGDQFGYSVAVDGDTAVIGAYTDDSYTGSAYVFTRSGTTWTQQAKLTASNRQADDWFGLSVDVDGDTAVIGAHRSDSTKGTAYVFRRSGTAWSQEATLSASDGAAGDALGYSVSVSGDTAVIGAHGGNANQGAAYVFTRSGSTWAEQTKLTRSGGAPNDYFGVSVSVDGEAAVIGAYGENSFSGSAYVFTRSGTTWSQEATLTAPTTGSALRSV